LVEVVLGLVEVLLGLVEAVVVLVVRVVGSLDAGFELVLVLVLCVLVLCVLVGGLDVGVCLLVGVVIGVELAPPW
jgi:hypothetical protein